jgi:hypothetical protein
MPVAGRLAILAAAAVLLVRPMPAFGGVAILAAVLLLLRTMPAAEVAQLCRSAVRASRQCIIPAAGVVVILAAAAVLLLVGTAPAARVAEVRGFVTRAAWFKVHVNACCCCCW